ncbi:VOC family protein [Paenibacillus sp. PR3]|uniref:VOC family protein n=1 Tax=Paenibacillus terricola TaxID=2763503 RepID=A0ABR8MR45_9BACL|nr:VOC family protein [Paenibacillus terricola]MBD3918462.1 VOC family protein [Paenibacillus terricola]
MKQPIISHVQVPVTDLDQAVEWYCNIFGCRLEGNFGVFASVTFGNEVNLFLWKTEDVSTANFTVGGEAYPVFGVEVDDMDALSLKLEASGVKQTDGIVTDGEGRRFLKFQDPFGNLIVTHEEPK